jgi:hypothetical protein
MAASGHKPSNVHDRYLNFTHKQMTDALAIVMIARTAPKNGPDVAPQQNG